MSAATLLVRSASVPACSRSEAACGLDYFGKRDRGQEEGIEAEEHVFVSPPKTRRQPALCPHTCGPHALTVTAQDAELFPCFSQTLNRRHFHSPVSKERRDGTYIPTARRCEPPANTPSKQHWPSRQECILESSPGAVPMICEKRQRLINGEVRQSETHFFLRCVSD